MLTVKNFTRTAVITLGLVLAGCSTTGSQRIDSTTSSMASIEDLIEQGENRLNTLMASMDAMDDAEDLDRANRDFRRSVKDIENTSERIRERRIAMEAQAAEHATLWRSETAQLSGERATEISENRRADFEEAVADVGDELDELRAAYEPFIAKLRDLQVMLSNDLTRR
ncbi:MAG: hypothetical protein WD114_00620, partial [Phycisphaerales bacterium]